VFEKAAELVQAGAYGRPMASIFRDDQYFPIQGMYGSTWRKDVDAAGGGTLIEHSIHDVDVLRWILGDPVRLRAQTSSRFGHVGIEDVAAISFEYPDGATAQLTSIWHQVLTRESSRRLEIFCEHAFMWTEDDYLGPLHVQTSDGTEVFCGDLPPWADRLTVPEVFAKAVAAYATPTKAFLDALAASGPAAIGRPSAAEALAAHRLVDLAYRSAAAGSASESARPADPV
jgi:predicted dehydrogenase